MFTIVHMTTLIVTEVSKTPKVAVIGKNKAAVVMTLELLTLSIY